MSVVLVRTLLGSLGSLLPGQHAGIPIAPLLFFVALAAAIEFGLVRAPQFPARQTKKVWRVRYGVVVSAFLFL